MESLLKINNGLAEIHLNLVASTGIKCETQHEHWDRRTSKAGSPQE